MINARKWFLQEEKNTFWGRICDLLTFLSILLRRETRRTPMIIVIVFKHTLDITGVESKRSVRYYKQMVMCLYFLYNNYVHIFDILLDLVLKATWNQGLMFSYVSLSLQAAIVSLKFLQQIYGNKESNNAWYCFSRM